MCLIGYALSAISAYPWPVGMQANLSQMECHRNHVYFLWLFFAIWCSLSWWEWVVTPSLWLCFPFAVLDCAVVYIEDTDALVSKLEKSCPNLRYLSLLGNRACPHELLQSGHDDEDYQKYRCACLHWAMRRTVVLSIVSILWIDFNFDQL